MRKRGYVRLTDDSQLDQIDSIVSELRSQGFEVSEDNLENAKITGQLAGEAAEEALPDIRNRAAAFGARFTSEEDDMEHRLPDPRSDLQ